MTSALPALIEGPRLSANLARLALAEMPASRPAVRRALDELAQVIERDRLLRPVAVCRTFPVLWEGSSRLRLSGEHALDGDFTRLCGAAEIAVVFVTIGAAWSEAIAGYFRRGDGLRGVLLDEIGTAALERLSHRLEAVIRISARARGLHAGSPLSPGDPCLPLKAQFLLAELAQARAHGIDVTSTGMLAPVKSGSMIIGIGKGLRRWTHASTCRECPSWGRCRKSRRCSERYA